jgi:hypothetical protein
VNYTVIWGPTAERNLDAIGLGASDQSAVVQAALALDQRLRTDPANEGESRPGGRRVAFEPPLGILFRIDEPNRLVRVLRAWRVGPRPRP